MSRQHEFDTLTSANRDGDVNDCDDDDCDEVNHDDEDDDADDIMYV